MLLPLGQRCQRWKIVPNPSMTHDEDAEKNQKKKNNHRDWGNARGGGKGAEDIKAAAEARLSEDIRTCPREITRPRQSSVESMPIMLEPRSVTYAAMASSYG